MLWPAVFFFLLQVSDHHLSQQKLSLVQSHQWTSLTGYKNKVKVFFFFFQVIKKEFLLTKSIHYQAEGWWEKRWKYEIWNTVYLSTKISQIIRVQKIDIYISEVQLWKRYFYRHSTCIRFCLFTLKLRVSIILIQKVLWENQETSKNVLMSISKTMLFLMNLER